MTETDTATTTEAPGAGLAAPATRLRWWREAIYIAAFYGIYTVIRNRGVATDNVSVAFNHAKQIIHAEEVLKSFHEATIQGWFIEWRGFMEFWNVFYGSAHFIVTALALILLFRRMPARYPLWRNTLAATTGLALVGFWMYPLMPPRLLPASYEFVDSLKVIGGLWNFDSGAMAKISNQYAAMPSLHCAWAMWSSCVLWPMVRRWWLRALIVIYPWLTLFCIVVTANHYWLDAAGGALMLGIGYLVATVITRWAARRASSPARLAPAQ
jgi:hypothetical protein